MDRYSDKLKGKVAVKLNSVNYGDDQTTVRVTSSDGVKISLNMRRQGRRAVKKTDEKTVSNFAIKYVMYNGRRMTKAEANRLKARYKQMGIKPLRTRLEPVRASSGDSNNEVSEVQPRREPTKNPTIQNAAQLVNELLDISMLKGLQTIAVVEILKQLKKPTDLQNLAINPEIYSTTPLKVISLIPTLPKSVTISMINLLMKKRDGKGERQLTGLARDIATTTIGLIQAHHKEQRELLNRDKRRIVVFDDTTDTEITKKSGAKKPKKTTMRSKATSKPQRLPSGRKLGLPSERKRNGQRRKRAPPIGRAMNQNINDSEWIPDINEDPSFETYKPNSQNPPNPSPSTSPDMGYMVINDESILRVIRKRLLSRLDEINEIEKYIKPYHDVFQAYSFVNMYIDNGLSEDTRVSGLLSRAIEFLKRSGTYGEGLVARGLKANKAIKGGETVTGLKTANFPAQLKSVIQETKRGRGESLTYARLWLTRFGTREVRVGVGNNERVRTLEPNENVRGEWVLGNKGTPEYRADPFRNAQTERRSIHETVIGMEFHPLWVVGVSVTEHGKG